MEKNKLKLGYALITNRAGYNQGTLKDINVNFDPGQYTANFMDSY